MSGWLLACVFASGIVIGLCWGIPLAVAAGRVLRLHICPGHLEHEREFQNPNIVPPTPTH